MRSAVIAGAIFCALAQATHAGVVEDANEAMTRAFQAESPAPVLASRNLAILHLAMHDSMHAGRQDRGLWLNLKGIHAAEDGETAARAAALTVCRSLYPGRASDFEKLALPEKPTAPQRRSAETGRLVAMAWLEERKDDGSSTTIHYVPGSAPGQWRRTPPANRPPEMPHWGKVRPFVIRSADVFRPPAPPGLETQEFRENLAEVATAGTSTSKTCTEEQTMIAKFWSDFSYTSTPPGHWNAITCQISRERKLTLEESARLFALLNAAMADAGIAIWDCKYHWNAWRPVTALRNRESGNNGSEWLPLLATPPHPEYVSGHSGFSGAAASVLGHFFGTDRVRFSVSSDTLPGITRRFGSFSACAAEVSESRIFGGIHFRFSCESGLRLGSRVGEAVWSSAPR